MNIRIPSFLRQVGFRANFIGFHDPARALSPNEKAQTTSGLFGTISFLCINVARPTGFEPVTYRFVAGHSIR